MSSAQQTRQFRSLGSIILELFRALVLAAAFGLWTLSVSIGAAAWWAMLAAFVGSLIGAALGISRLRSLPVLLVSALSVVIVVVLGGALSAGSMGTLLSPQSALWLREVLQFAGGAGLVAFMLRFCSTRWPTFTLLELAIMAGAGVRVLAAHRDGAIHRPFDFADPIIALGWDPVPILIGFGALAAIFATWILMRESRFGRAFFHFAVFALLVLAVTSFVQQVALPKPQDSAWVSGLRPDEKAKERSQGKSGKSRGQDQGSQQDPDFSSGDNDSGSNAPVAVVLFHDDYSPSDGVYYFRQGAFSQYNGRRLISATRAEVDQDLIANFPLRADDKPTPAQDLEQREEVATTVALISDHFQPFALDLPVRVEPATNPDPRRFRRAYRATSQVLRADWAELLTYGVGEEDWGAEKKQHYTEAPSDTRYLELAERIIEGLPERFKDNQVAKALMIADWLGQNGIYSFKNEHTGPGDPTASFLFGDLTGYCVHFSHAATYLFRSLGIPARVANGYAVNESFRRGGASLVITGAYAHAWPELYIEDIGWVIVDIAPVQSLVPPPQPADPDLQQLLGELARGEEPTLALASQWPEYIARARRTSIRFAWVFASVVLALFLGMVLIKIWRRVIPYFASERALPRVLYRAELDRLSELALRRRRGESREAFAKRHRTDLPTLALLTDAHIRAAFSERAEIPASVLWANARQLRQELQSSVPWWRRYLGVLMPWSWLVSR